MIEIPPAFRQWFAQVFRDAIEGKNIPPPSPPFGTTACGKCKYRDIDGGPSPAMTCEHPDAPDHGYIVKWDDDHRHRGSYRCPIKAKEKQ